MSEERTLSTAVGRLHIQLDQHSKLGRWG